MTLARPVIAAAPAANTEKTDLIAGALDALKVAMEVRDLEGRRVFGNPLASDLFDAEDGSEVSDQERMVGKRAYRIERRRFALDGVAFRAAFAYDIEDQRRLQEELFQRAYFDPLTGLPNRELCDRAIGDFIAPGAAAAPFALAIIQVDQLAQISAIFGSSGADALIGKIAERIAQTQASDEWLARTGVDEFCLLIPQPRATAELLARIGALVGRLSDPFLVDGAEMFASAKAGFARFPGDASDTDGLWSAARAALAEARRQIGARARAFEPQIERAGLERARTELGLRAAIRDRRIGCAFQPKVDFRADKVDSLEVLMRWRDEDGEWHSPGAFLDLAHSVGLTNDITRLVFEETLASLDTIAQTFGPGLHVGFNISAKQAGDSRFMRRFAEDLAATGQAGRFVLELTEEAFLPAVQFQARVLPFLREIGARISIDDFGAGFSSLATLADITADEVKVDRSLIVGIHAKPRNQTLLRAIESIGEALGMEVMVEGVETAEELDYLRARTSIRVAQGYFLGRPIVLSQAAGAVGAAFGRSTEPPRERAGANTRSVERRQD